MLARRFAALAALLGALAMAAALAAALVPTASRAQEPVRRLYLPLVGSRADLESVPIVPTLPPLPAATPTDAATATDVATPTDAPTATDVPTPTATPFVCGPLPDRLRVTDLDLGEDRIRTGGPDFWTTNPIFTARQRGGTTWVGWPDTAGNVHLTPLDADEQRSGPDVVVQGDEIRGLVAHDDGLALLVVDEPVVCAAGIAECSHPASPVAEHSTLSLVRLGAEGQELWRKALVGAAGMGARSKWIDWQPHESRLAWDGRRYAAYIGHTYNTGGSGTHQGDLLWYFDEDGTQVDADEGWDWGCSHSLDVRLAWNASRFGPVCLSDLYPTKAFHFNHREQEIRKEPSGDAQGGSEARLGGLVATRDGFMMSFASPRGGSTSMRDIGVLRIANDASIGAITWLTTTSDVGEDGPHLAAYGTGLLATWAAGGEHLALELDAAGKPSGEPTALGARIAPKDDLLGNLPGGDVLWATVGPQPGVLRVARLDYCQPR